MPPSARWERLLSTWPRANLVRYRTDAAPAISYSAEGDSSSGHRIGSLRRYVEFAGANVLEFVREQYDRSLATALARLPLTVPGAGWLASLHPAL